MTAVCDSKSLILMHNFPFLTFPFLTAWPLRESLQQRYNHFCWASLTVMGTAQVFCTEVSVVSSPCVWVQDNKGRLCYCHVDLIAISPQNGNVWMSPELWFLAVGWGTLSEMMMQCVWPNWMEPDLAHPNSCQLGGCPKGLIWWTFFPVGFMVFSVCVCVCLGKGWCECFYVCVQGCIDYFLNVILYSYLSKIIISKVTFGLPKLSNLIWLLSP